MSSLNDFKGSVTASPSLWESAGSYHFADHVDRVGGVTGLVGVSSGSRPPLPAVGGA